MYRQRQIRVNCDVSLPYERYGASRRCFSPKNARNNTVCLGQFAQARPCRLTPQWRGFKASGGCQSHDIRREPKQIRGLTSPARRWNSISPRNWDLHPMALVVHLQAVECRLLLRKSCVSFAERKSTAIHDKRNCRYTASRPSWSPDSQNKSPAAN